MNSKRQRAQHRKLWGVRNSYERVRWSNAAAADATVRLMAATPNTALIPFASAASRFPALNANQHSRNGLGRNVAAPRTALRQLCDGRAAMAVGRISDSVIRR